MKWNDNKIHNKFRNHSQQTTLYSYILYCGLIALTPGLEHSTSQIPFPRSTLCSSSAESPLLSVVHSPCSAVWHKIWFAMTRMSNFCYPVALYSAYYTPQSYFTVLVWVSLEYSVSLHTKVLATLMSETSQVVTLLGTVAFCYSIFELVSSFLPANISRIVCEMWWLQHHWH
jgi:hypothetical protein